MSRMSALIDRIRAAQDRLEKLQAGTDPESPLGRLDTFMAGFDHMGTGDTADEAASIEEWAELRADLTGVIRRPFGYAGPVFPLDACVWFRDSTGEWVLELAGAINETSLTCRHTQPGDLAPEEVPGLPALHGVEAAARSALGPVLDWYQPDEEMERPLPELIADAAEGLVADRTELLALRRSLIGIRDRTGEPETREAADAALGRLRLALSGTRDSAVGPRSTVEPEPGPEPG
jgi:hypothetical protein